MNKLVGLNRLGPGCGRLPTPPYIGYVVSPRQTKVIREVLASVGIECQESLKAATKHSRLQNTLKKIPFFKEVKSVPGHRGTFDITLPDNKLYRGDLKFIFT